MSGTTSYYSNAIKRPVISVQELDRFRLDPEFLSTFEGREPDWGPVGLFTFKRTYARPVSETNDKTEEFWQTLERIVNGIYSIQKWHCRHHNLPWSDGKAQRSAQTMFRLMWDFKFLPGGRGLWMMGTDYVERHGSAALNNPLHEDTKILTREHGWTRLGDIEGQKVHVLSSAYDYGSHAKNVSRAAGVSTSKWVEANISHVERHPCLEIEFEDRSGNATKIVSSQNHRWFRRRTTKQEWERVATEELRVGDYVPIVKPYRNFKPSPIGFLHGMFFGDGTRSNGELHLFGAKADVAQLVAAADVLDAVTRDGELVLRQCPIAWGSVPTGDYQKDQRYVWGFLSGYVAADGHVDEKGNVSISSARRDELVEVAKLFRDLGVRVSEPIETIQAGATNNLVEDRSALYAIKITPIDLDSKFFLRKDQRERWETAVGTSKRDWMKVKSIAGLTGEWPVLCAEVPGYEQFVIDGFILTSNCAFTSTQDIDISFAEPFCFLMDFSMLGVGVGSDCRGAGKVTIVRPAQGDDTHVVEDSREGWVDILFRVLEAYVGNGSLPKEIDYSKVRPYGSLIKGFGGTASGPDPLIKLIFEVRRVLEPLIGKPITSEAIVDLCDLIGVCVVAGNIRRTAIIMFGDGTDEGFLNLKNPALNSAAMKTHRWASNNSVLADVGMDYTQTAAISAKAGEPGYIWLDNARKFGRMGEPCNDHRVLGFNPCAEISLESYELCVSGQTKIQTRTGVLPIEDLVGKKVDVWNGDSWSTVEPRITGLGRDLYRVTLSDGSYLDCTANHGWHVRPSGKQVFRRVETQNLKSGDKVVEFDISAPISGRHEPNAFEWGLFAGDGYIEKQADYPMVAICGEKGALKDLDVGGVWYKPQILEGYSAPYNRLCLRGLLTMEDATHINDKTNGLPQSVFNMDRESTLQFVAGWIESDGTITNKGVKAEGYRIYGAESKMRDLQILLRRIGINHSTIRLFGEEGDVTNFGERNYDLWYCQIPSYECAEIPTRLKTIDAIGPRYAVNNAYPDGASIDRARKQKVISVERLSGKHTTYCFEEPENHMAVFGNVLTYQCNLVELFPSRHSSYEEFERTIKYAYLYAKTVSLIPTHNPKTNAVMLRNRRIGLSQSGIVQSFKRHGRRKHFTWCDQGYAYVTKLDRIYSEWLCVRKSIKKTTVKPAGTTSLLPGVTPGIHFEHADYYFRTVRVAKHNPIVEEYRNAGYRVEDDVYDQHGRTAVIYFPIKAQLFDRGKSEVSIWEQMENAAQMQKVWSDNSVSVTVTFKPEEASDIQRCLELYEGRMKTVSFLPLDDHGYEQAPYITITKEEYEAASSLLGDASFNNIGHDIDATPKYCDGDSCVVPARATKDQALP